MSNKSDAPQTIAAAWARLEQVAMPAAASRMQRREMRRAFYAGATSLMCMMMECLDPTDQPTELDFARMDKWHHELVQFGASVRTDSD